MAELAELVHVDPATLVIGANVRTDTHPDAKAFSRSIRERGVLETITAHLNEEGQLVVLRGQRRTLVAAEVGTPTGTVPVRVVDSPDESDRIVDQVTENMHREAMRNSEVVNAVEQLALVGVSAAQIAKRTQIKRKDVDAAITITASPNLREQVDANTVSLEDAAFLAEFENDPDATATLMQAIDWGRPLEHVVQRLRDEAADRAALTDEIERLRDEGIPVLDPVDVPPSLWDRYIHRYVDAEGNDIDEGTLTNHDGVAAVASIRWEYPESGDENEDDDEDVQPTRKFITEWIVTDPEAAGLHPRHQGRDEDSGPTDEEKEAAKVERQRVIANNKAWRSAETVRRAWLTSFVARKTVPAGAEALICEAVVGARWDLGKAIERDHPMLRELLGESTETYGSEQTEAIARLVTQPKTAKAQVIRTLAAVLAAWEATTSTHTWRNPNRWDERIMRALTGWGYKPSEVEELLLTDADA